MGEPSDFGDIIDDVENYRNPNENKFNHQVLVMTVMKKCIEMGSRELREGWWDEKVDKWGNIRREYHEDTRRCFIESVKTAMSIMHRDYDTEKTKDRSQAITKVKDQIEERKKYWIKQETLWWRSLNPAQKEMMIKQGRDVQEGMFNPKNPFDNLYYGEELDFYRDIMTILNDLTKDLMDYGNEDIEV